MAYLILGLLAFGLVVAVGHYASRIDPRLLARSLRYLIGGGLIGWLLDRWLGTSPWLMLILLVLAIVAAGRNIYKISKERAE